MKNYIYVSRISVAFFKIFVVSEGWHDFSPCAFNSASKTKFFIKRFGHSDAYQMFLILFDICPKNHTAYVSQVISYSIVPLNINSPKISHISSHNGFRHASFL